MSDEIQIRLDESTLKNNWYFSDSGENEIQCLKPVITNS